MTVTRFCAFVSVFFALAICTLMANPALGALSASPNPSSDGNYTVTGSFTLGTNDTGFTIYETAPDGTVTALEVEDPGDISLSFIDKPHGTYSYQAWKCNVPTDIPIANCGDVGSELTVTVLVPAVTVSFSSASYSATEGGSSATVTVNLSADPERQVVIPIKSAAADGATAQGKTGADYSGIPANVTITSGSTSANFEITATDDKVDDDGESVSLSFGTLPSRVTAGSTTSASVTLTDNDTRGVTVSETAVTVTEALTATYTVVLDSQPTGTVTVTPTSGDTTVATVSGALTFLTSNWSTPQEVTVTGADNDVHDGEDRMTTITHSVAGGDYGSVSAASVGVKLEDDESLPTVSLVLTPDSISENGGTSTATATLSGKSSQAVTLTVSASGPSSRFRLSTNKTLTIDAGTTVSEGTVTLTGVDNNIHDGEATVTVEATASGGNGVSAPADKSLTITDDDAAPTGIRLSVNPTSVDEDDGATTVTVTATVTGGTRYATARTVSVSVAGSGMATAVDFTPVPGFNISIGAGAASGSATFTLTPSDDSVDETQETITVAGTSFGVTVTSATLTLNDDDAAPTGIRLSVNPTSVDEDDGATTVTVTATVTGGTRYATARTVSVSVAGSGMATAVDFTPVPGFNISIGAGAASGSATFTLTPSDDSVDETQETITVAGTSSGVTVTSATLTLNDDDALPTVNLVLTPDSISENGGTSTATATLSGKSSQAVTLTVSAAAVSPAVAGDFTLSANKTLTIAAESTTSSGTVMVTANDNDVDAAAKTVTVSATANGGNGVAPPSDRTLTITDDDDPQVAVSYSAATYTATEGGTAARVTVSLSVDPERQVVIPIRKSHSGGATSSDYSGIPADVTIASGSTSATFTVTATDDSEDDDGESVALSFGTLPDRVTAGSRSIATVKLVDDDDPQVTVSYSASTYAATEGGAKATVTVNLSADPERSVTIPLESAPSNGATAQGETGADYSGIPANVTIASGSTSTTFTVAATDDTVDDDDESVALSFGTLPDGVTAGSPATATVNLVDDDVPPVTASFSAATYTATEGGTAATVTVNLSADPERSVTIPLESAPSNGATAQGETGADYSGIPANVTIASGSTSATFTVAATDDSVDDDGESVALSFGTLPDGVTAGSPSTAAVQITDDDTRGVTVSTSAVTVTEAPGSARTATYTVVLDSEPTGTVTVTPSSDDTSVARVPGALTFTTSNWDDAQDVTVTGVDNNVDNAASFTATVSHTVSGADYGSVTAADVSVTLTDDDPSPTVTLSLSSASIAENGGTSTVTASLSHPSSAETTVTVSAAGPSGSYALSGDTLTIAAGETASTGTVTVTASDDTVDQPDKTVTVSGVAANTHGVTGPVARTLTIEDDDDPQVTVSYSAATYTATEGGAAATVTVNLSADAGREVAIPIGSAARGGATAQGDPGADYSGIPASVTFASGETQQTFTVTATDDSEDDDGESVALSFGTLPDGVTAGSQTTATVNLADDDDPQVTVSYSAATYTATEGGAAATVTVELSADPERQVAIPIGSAVADGATAQGETGADYSGIPASVTFASGETQQTFTVTATDDSEDDDGESVALSFGTLPDGVTAGSPATTTVNLADDDTRGVTLSTTELSVDEGDSDTYTVVLDAEPTDTVTVTIGGASGTDVSVDDDTLEFTTTDWSMPQTVTVNALADSDGVNDSVTLTHTPSGGGYDAVTIDGVAVTVDSTPRLRSATVNGISLVLTYAEALDDTSTPAAGAFAVTVAGSDSSHTVSGVSIGGSAVTLTLSSAVSFGATVTVTYAVPSSNPIRDKAGNDAEAFADQAVTNETKDAVTVSFSAATYKAEEGGTAATVTVNLSADPGQEVTIPIDSAAENGATAQGDPGADYSGIPASVTIASGSTSATFTVTAEDDDIDDDDETVALGFGTLPDGFTAGSPATATVNLADDDARGVTLSKTELSVAEGNSGTYTVVLDSEPTGDVTVTFASDNADVTVDTSNTDNDLVFTAENWETPQTVMVSAAADDDTVDDTATIAHAVSGGDYADVDVASVTVSVTVTEVDSTPRLQSAVANRGSLVLTYGEPLDSGSTPGAEAFAVTVEGSDSTHTVSGVSIGGNAVTLTLSPAVDIGATVTVSYTVPATNPIQDEAGNDADPLTDRAVVNETAVEVTVSFAAATYTAEEGGAAATVTVTLSADPERELAIPILAAPTDGATAQGEPGADYSGIPESVTIADGATEATFSVAATEDTVDDDGESVALSFGMLPAGVTATGQTAAAVAITDNDTPSWSVTVSPATLIEAGGMSTLTVSTGGTVTLPGNKTIALALSGTATAGTDYTISAGGQALSSPYSVTLPAGDTSVTATLTAVSDSMSDMDETATIEARLDSTVLGTATATIVEGICGRTATVRDAIVAAIGSGATCGDVTAAQLAGIATLTLADSSLSSLQAGDFDGLTGLTALDLKANQLTSLPANIFDGLSSLSVLNLKNNRLTSLPANIFGGLSALTRLTLENNRVNTLRSDAFSGLSSLQELVLRKNRLTSLPAGIFSGLSALTDLNLRNNDLNNLPGDVFAGLTSLDVLLLQSNDLSSLPDGLFAGLGGLTHLRLDGNNALSMSVSLAAVGDDRFKAVAPVGAPFELELPVSVTAGGKIAGSATRITIPAGAVESAPLTVNRTAGTYAAVTADLGALPGLPRNHQGYSLARSSDLPLEVLAAVALPTVSIAAVSAEVTEGAGAAFTLTRTGATDASVDVSVRVTESGTVLETASDYASAVTVSIPTGSATATLTVATDDDAVDEALTGEAGVAGRITAAIQSGSLYTPAGSPNDSATVDVRDNDPLETVVTPTDSALVGNLGQNPVGSLFVHRTMTLYQAFTTGSDAPGHDGFVLGSVSANVQNVPDTASGVTVSIYSADTLGRPDSSLHTLTNPASFATGANTFTAPANATLDAGTTYFVAVAYTGTDPLDFQLLSTASVNEDAGGATGWSIADSEHGVSSGVLMIGLDGRAVAAPTASLSVAGGRAEEGADTSIDFAVTLDRTSAQNVTVSYRTVDGTALAGQDYSAASGMLTFSPGDTSKTVSVTVLDDLVDEAEERFTLILYNASGANVANARATGTIANSDPLPQAWLVRFGRTVATHVADGIGERLTRARADTPEATFAGLRMPFGQEQPVTPPNALFGGDPGQGHQPWNQGWGNGLAHYGASDSEQLPSVPGASSRGLTARDLLVGSSFVAPLTEGDETGAGWTWWGRGMASRFDGTEDNLNLDGDVKTWMLGADTQRGRWLAGVALAHSTGAGGYDAALAAGRTERGVLETAMTSVHPYARFAVNERLSAWGILGYGAGELTLDREGAGLWTTDTSMLMGAAGARGVLRPAAFAAGTELAIRTDVMWTSIASEEAETAAGRLAGSDGTASRLRLLLEGSRTFAFDGARTLTPTLEFGLRQDASDAENGAGIELGGGLRFADPARGLSVELKARGLVAHRDADYSEWGASAAIQFDPGIAGKGLMLSLAPSWGAASSGAERLWSQPDAHGLAPYGEFLPEGRLDAELGYAMTGPKGRGMQTPYAALSQADAGDRTLRLGWRLAMSPLRSLDLEGIHRQPANGGPAENALLLRMALRW